MTVVLSVPEKFSKSPDRDGYAVSLALCGKEIALINYVIGPNSGPVN
jgi:hypothetical protein